MKCCRMFYDGDDVAQCDEEATQEVTVCSDVVWLCDSCAVEVRMFFWWRKMRSRDRLVGGGLDLSFPYLAEQARTHLSLAALDAWNHGLDDGDGEALEELPLFATLA